MFTFKLNFSHPLIFLKQEFHCLKLKLYALTAKPIDISKNVASTASDSILISTCCATSSKKNLHFQFLISMLLYFFAGVIYGFKGLILVFGLFLAYETRSIKVKQINDSRYVAMSIYNIAVLCLITAPVAMVIVSILNRIFPCSILSSLFSVSSQASQQDASFVFVSLAVIFCCFLSMLLIFVPKVSTHCRPFDITISFFVTPRFQSCKLR